MQIATNSAQRTSAADAFMKKIDKWILELHQSNYLIYLDHTCSLLEVLGYFVYGILISFILRIFDKFHDMFYTSIVKDLIRVGGGSPAFCRSLHEIGQCGSGKMRHTAAKCFLQLKIA